MYFTRKEVECLKQFYQILKCFKVVSQNKPDSELIFKYIIHEF